MSNTAFLAVDLGASSGRHVAGLFDGGKLALHEVHRFQNGPVAAQGNLHWDLLQQWTHITNGLRAAHAQNLPVRSVGVDTWGVDFGLLDRNDQLLGNPFHYRDARTNGLLERAFEVAGRDEIFAHSGLQFMQFNTLYQLWAMKLAGSPQLEIARSLLMMPDLFHWLLTGVKANEYTDATTTQFFDPQKNAWSSELLGKFGVPTQILQPIVQPGTRLGPLLPNVAEACGLTGVDVVVPGTHDTASAVMAVPAASQPGEKPNWCYISSGTWSLMGVEMPRPVVNAKCQSLNFTNEGGVGNTTRLLKNIGGLWLVQECRRIWNSQGHNYQWHDLTHLSAAAPPLAAVIDPDDASLLAPADMPQAIRNYCQRTGQTPPDSHGAVIRCAIESLALKYRLVLGWLEELIDGPLETIHIVGGGTQNRQLCQATADACGRRVLAGPVEATAIGNLMVQALAAGEVGSIAQAREVIRNSFPVEEYRPQNSDRWQAAFARFKTLQPQ